MPAFRNHDPARKFHCEVPECSASFVKRAHLRRHEMTHTQRRDFTCPGCSRAFSRNDSMARHLRRKHPHLYRSSQDPSATMNGIERLYPGVATTSANAFASSRNKASTSGYSALPLRQPFNGIMGNFAAPRGLDQPRLVSESLERSSRLSEVCSRDGVPHSPKGSPLLHWNAPVPSRCPNASLPPAFVSSYDGCQEQQPRFSYALKEDVGYLPHTSMQTSLFTNPDSTGRADSTRRGPDGNAAVSRALWTQAPNADYRSDHGATNLFQWEQRSEQAFQTHTCASGGSTNLNVAASESATRLTNLDQRDESQGGFFDSAGESVLQPGFAPVPSASRIADTSTRHDVLQSEFFVGTMWPHHDDPSYASNDPYMLPMQPSEQVRIEPPADPGHPAFGASFLLPGPGTSPAAHSTAAADAFFAIDHRNLCEQAGPAAPPNASQVEQIMADLGINFSSRQASGNDASHSFSSSMSFAQPISTVPAGSIIPSQGTMASAMRFHPNPLSQSYSSQSQSSLSLPSLTESQNEYLGPNATSHRRLINRVFSTASAAFDANSQNHGGQGSSQNLTDDYDESLGRRTVAAMKLESQEDMAIEPVSNRNFTKPHDLSPSQRAAWDEEGERKSARSRDDVAQGSTLSDAQRFQSADRQDARLQSSTIAVHADHGVAPLASPTSSNMTTTRDPPLQAPGVLPSSHDQDSRGDMDVEDPALPIDAQPIIRLGSASGSISVVNGDQLQLVVDRYRVFAQLCQDHLHPSAKMLESLAPLIPKMTHTAAPFFHPKMIGSQKAHSSEEIIALLSLASLQSSDASLQEEGERLICLMLGLVMLSCRHTLQFGGKLQSFLRCFLLVGMHGMCQNTPDLWLTFEQNRDAILADVLQAEARTANDHDMDRIETDGLLDMGEEELFCLWSQWYEQESRKRTLLVCAILDSQSSGYFSPLKVNLSARPAGPRCQFLFANVHEPCPDVVFLAWPPKVWATRLTTSVSVPSAKGVEMASQGGELPSLAACLAEQLFRPHMALHYNKSAPPRFRNSFDFSSQPNGGSSLKQSQSDHSQAQDVCTQTSALSEPLETPDSSARSSRRPSQAGLQIVENGTAPQARTVSQLYMSALLEAIHGAWMTDSGWYQASAWGATALSDSLRLDDDGYHVDCAGLNDLPGWRVGRTLDATQVAHALMNWSNMFSGRKDGCHTECREDIASSGIKLADDVFHLTIRWQAIFLGLCTPLTSICFYLDASNRSSTAGEERHRRITTLLTKWVDSPYCRRALVHASTVFTLLCAIKSRSRLGAATAHAAYVSLAVLVCTSKILIAKHLVNSVTVSAVEELVLTKQVWSILLKSVHQDDKNAPEKSCNDGSDIRDSEEWLRVRFWHRRYQFLGLAGIFVQERANLTYKPFVDWRPLTSNLFQRPRWSSYAEEARGSDTTHSTNRVQPGNNRRSSLAPILASQQDEDRDSLRRHLLNNAAGPVHPATRTRQWILKGATDRATFCGLAISSADTSDAGETGASHKQDNAAKALSHAHLRELVMWVRNKNPAWCFSHEYTSLLLGALENGPADARATAESSNDGGCTV